MEKAREGKKKKLPCLKKKKNPAVFHFLEHISPSPLISQVLFMTTHTSVGVS